MAFALHPRLLADTVFVADWELSRVLLMNDRRFPWLVLVPRREALSEWFDLDQAARGLLGGEMALAGERLKAWSAADKINIGTLGNLVPQLHVHVVARRTGDSAWPGPVWGAGQTLPYEGAERDHVVSELCRIF